MEQALRPSAADDLLHWFWQVKRDLPWRKTKDPYAIWVSEIMLQQTQIKTVIPYYHTFLAHFPTIQALAEAELEEVLSIWRGLGYYSRARHLWEGARYVWEREGGELPGTYKGLLAIPGVGEYTAGAIASIAFGERVPAIDGNVSRVLARVLAWPEPIGKAKSRRAFREVLAACQPSAYPGDFNQALMELGETLCTPQAVQCGECPLQPSCAAHAGGDEWAFPLKQGHPRVSDVLRFNLLIRMEDRLLIQKRPSHGLLAQLWEFPGEERFCSEAEGPLGSPKEWYELYQRIITDRSHDKDVWRQLNENLEVQGPLYHTFTHRRWEMYWIVLEWTGDGINPERDEDALRWVSAEDLITMAFPVAFQKISRAWQEGNKQR